MKIFACTFLVIAGLGVSWAPAAGGPYRELSAEEKAKLDAVLPEKAPAAAAKPRKLLIYTPTWATRARSIRSPIRIHANGAENGDLHTVSRDPALLTCKTEEFDAVCLHTPVGNLFTDPVLREPARIVLGGAACGHPRTTVAFTDFPQGPGDLAEFGRMIGGRGAAHLAQDDARHQARLARPLAQPALRRQGFRAPERVLSRPRPYSAIASTCSSASTRPRPR